MKNTITCVKRLLGRQFKDPIVQAELPRMPFKVVEMEDGNVGVEVMHNNEKQVCLKNVRRVCQSLTRHIDFFRYPFDRHGVGSFETIG